MKLKKKAKPSPSKTDTEESKMSTPQKRKPEENEVHRDSPPPVEKRLKTSSDGTIVDRLRGHDPVSALKEIVAEGGDHDDLIGEFLSHGGQTGDLLRLLESEEKTKSPEVALVFQAVETVLLHVASGSDRDGASAGGGALAQDLIRKVLHGHFRYVVLLLSQSNTAYQAKSCLRMLSAMVATGGAAGAREILTKVDFDHKNFSSVVKRRGRKEDGAPGSNDVRTCYIHFLLAFLVSGNAALTKDFLEKKNNVSQIFPGLIHDSCETVTLVLTTLREKIVENSSVSKTCKMKLFGVFNLKPLLQLFHWKGAHSHNLVMSDDQQAEFTGDLERVSDSVSAFFKSLLTSTKLGIVFHDPTCGNSGRNQNHLLLNLLKSFEKPWEQPRLSELIAEALRTCPDQLRPYLTCLEKVWSPRFTDCWLQVIDFLHVMFKRQDMLNTISELDSKQPKLISSVIANVGCPERVMKEVVIPALENEHYIIRRKGVDLLSLFVVNLNRVLDGANQSIKKSVLGRLAERIPSAQALSLFWDREATVLKNDDDNSLQYLASAASVLDFACTHYAQRYTALDLDMQKMLDQVMELTSGKTRAANEAQDVILVLLHHLARSASESMKRRDILELLLSVYVSSDGEKGRKLAAGTLVEVMTRGSVLAESEMAAVELEVWLHHMPRGADAEDPARNFLATQFSKQLSDSGNEDVMRLFLQRSSLGLNPVSVGLLEAYRDLGSDDGIAPYFDNVFQSIAAVHEDPLDVAKELLKGKIIQSTSKFLSSASLPLIHTDGAGKFIGLLNAFRLLLAVRISKGEDGGVSALGKLEEHITGLASKKGTATTILRQPFVQSLFQPFSESEGTKFVLAMISLSGKSEASNRIELAFRTKLDSEVFGGDADGGGYCSEEILRQCFETLRPSQAALCDLMVKALECSALAHSEMKATCLAAAFTTAVSRRLMMSREAEKAIRLHLPTVLVQVGSKPAIRSRLFPPVAAFLRHNPHMSDCMSVEDFEKLCRTTGYGGDNSGLIEALVAEREELSASFQEFVLSNVDPKSMLENIQEVFIRSLSVSRPRKKMLKFLTTSLKKNLSLGGSVTVGIIKLLKILCERCEQNLADILDNPANLEDVQVLWALFIMSKSGKELRPSVICDRILAPCLRMVNKSLKESDQKEGGSVPDLITAVTEVFLAEESCCIREYIEDDMWTSYVKVVLKTCLKSSLDDNLRSRYINGLSGLARLRYSNETEEDRVESSLIYNMIYGHSNFIAMMLDTVNAHCRAKASILRLILILTKIEPSVCAASHIPVYLGAYHGTLSLADQAILGIVCHYERCGGNLAQFKPILWGQSALGHYSARQKAGVGAALWKVPKTSEILALIESERMIRSAVDFPLRLELHPDAGEGGDWADDRARYDPRFFLPLLCQMCSPGVYIDRHLHLVECGALALVFASFSSRDKNMRAVGYVALARIYQQLELAKFSAEKKVWLHLVDVVRNGVRASKSANIQTLRIPPLVTTFLSRICHVLRSPLDPMYKSISSFVLAKPALELFKVPEFLRLFHSRELNHEEERRWILTVIRDGMRDEIDYSVAQKDYFIKMLLSFHDCAAMSDEGSRSLVRQIVAKAVTARKAAYDLVRHQGILAWVCSNALSCSSNGKVVAELAEIVTSSWNSVRGGDEKGDGDKVPATVLSEFCLSLDALAAACELAGEEAALKSTVRSLKAVCARKNLVSPRDVVIYSRCLT